MSGLTTYSEELIVGSTKKSSKKMDKEKSKKSIRSQLISYLRRELTYSTTHVLPQVVNKEATAVERIFWSFSLVLGLLMMVVFLTPLYTRFKQSATVMSVEMDYFNWNVSFPAISLCPKEKLDPEALELMLKEYALVTNLELHALFTTIAETTMENLDKMNVYTKKYIAVIKPEDYASIAARLLPTRDNTSAVDVRGRAARAQVAMTELGACHVLYSNQATADDPDKWRDPAAEYEDVRTSTDLTIHDGGFYTTIDNYADEYNIYIHSPDEVLLSSSRAVTHTGGALALGVRLRSIRLAPALRSAAPSARNCRLLDEPISPRYQTYSYSHCMLECRVRTIIRLCGCIPHFYKPLKNETICTLMELSCVNHYRLEIATLSSSPVTLRQQQTSGFHPSAACGCLTACDTDLYQIDQQHLDIDAKTELRVGIVAFPKVRVMRETIFGFYDIILRSGSVVNLCLGSSVISAMELILLILKISWMFVSLKLNKRFKKFRKAVIRKQP